MKLLLWLLELSVVAVFVDAGILRCFHKCINNEHSHCDCSQFDIISETTLPVLAEMELRKHHHHHPENQLTVDVDATADANIVTSGVAKLAVPQAAVPTPSTLTTTTDICDYLCSIQLGGDACNCSKPGLPGRK